LFISYFLFFFQHRHASGNDRTPAIALPMHDNLANLGNLIEKRVVFSQKFTNFA